MRKKSKVIILLCALSLSALTYADGWRENSSLFNSSGVPSLSFSQPRFADLDGDLDLDMIIGTTTSKPVYLTNVGTAQAPEFALLEEPFDSVLEIDAEMAVFHDLDADGDLDMITGGYTGLNLYENTGNKFFPEFRKVEKMFDGITVSSNPIADFADVDNDGDLDMVVGFSESGSVQIFINGGSDTAAVFLQSGSSTLTDVGLYAYPVFCDPDNDGDADILVGRDGYGLRYYQNNGTADSADWQDYSGLFAGLGENTYFNSPVLADISGDGLQDLIFGNSSGPLTYYKNTGTASSASWTLNSSLFGGVMDVGSASSPFFIDYDHDGDQDMFSGSQMGYAKYYENKGTAEVAVWKNDNTGMGKLKHSIYSFITLGDVTGDGLPDAIVGDLSGNLYYHVNSESGFGASTTIANITEWSAPKLIDMDYDGDLDIVAGNDEGNCFFFENTGTSTVPNWVEFPGYFGGLDVGGDCVPALIDFDYDHDFDLITGNISGKIQYFENQNGTFVEDTITFAGVETNQNATPAVGDLDGDGDKDLAFGDYNGTFKYYENLYPVLAMKPTDQLPGSYALGNYPNPFNPLTRITYTIPSQGFLEVNIFNLAGERITVLEQGIKAAGSYELLLDAGSLGLESGIYICQLKLNNMTVAQQKMTLIK